MIRSGYPTSTRPTYGGAVFVSPARNEESRYPGPEGRTEMDRREIPVSPKRENEIAEQTTCRKMFMAQNLLFGCCAVYLFLSGL